MHEVSCYFMDQLFISDFLVKSLLIEKKTEETECKIKYGGIL